MSIQFPANPPLNHTFDYEGKTYIWDGEKWTASAISSFDEAYVNINGDTMTGNLTVPSLNGGPLAGMRNQLINGDFRVWERGSNQTALATTSAQSIRADRWVTRNINEVGGSPTQGLFQDGNISKWRLVASGATSHCYLLQNIEAVNIRGLAGQQVTLSFSTSYGRADVWFQPFDGTDTVTTTIVAAADLVDLGNNRYSATFTMPTYQLGSSPEEKGMRIAILQGVPNQPLPNGNYDVWNIQLEQGPVATPFEHRPYGLELSLCQRYFYRTNGTISAYRTQTNDTRVIEYLFPVKMRIAPQEVDRESSSNTQGITTAISDTFYRGVIITPQNAGSTSFITDQQWSAEFT